MDVELFDKCVKAFSEYYKSMSGLPCREGKIKMWWPRDSYQIYLTYKDMICRIQLSMDDEKDIENMLYEHKATS